MTDTPHHDDVHQRAPFDEAPCECVITHVPRPTSVELHHPYPRYAQRARYGEVIDDRTVPLCPTAHTNVHDSLRARLRGEPHRLGNHRLRALVDEGLRRIREG